MRAVARRGKVRSRLQNSALTGEHLAQAIAGRVRVASDVLPGLPPPGPRGPVLLVDGRGLDEHPVAKG